MRKSDVLIGFLMALAFCVGILLLVLLSVLIPVAFGVAVGCIMVGVLTFMFAVNRSDNRHVANRDGKW